MICNNPAICNSHHVCTQDLEVRTSVRRLRNPCHAGRADWAYIRVFINRFPCIRAVWASSFSRWGPGRAVGRDNLGTGLWSFNQCMHTVLLKLRALRNMTVTYQYDLVSLTVQRSVSWNTYCLKTHSWWKSNASYELLWWIIPPEMLFQNFWSTSQICWALVATLSSLYDPNWLNWLNVMWL